MRRETPERYPWACDEFGNHGEFAVCAACFDNFARDWMKRTYKTGEQPDAPFVWFEESGWTGGYFTHWFDLVPKNVFFNGDKSEALVRSLCGSRLSFFVDRSGRLKMHAVFDDRKCKKCFENLRRAGRLREAE